MLIVYVVFTVVMMNMLGFIKIPGLPGGGMMSDMMNATDTAESLTDLMTGNKETQTVAPVPIINNTSAPFIQYEEIDMNEYIFDTGFLDDGELEMDLG